MKLPHILQNVIHQLTKIPGVGEKTALRQALTLSRWTPQELEEFGEAFKRLMYLKRCIYCKMYSEEEICHICNGHRAENGLLCVIETVADCLAIENSKTYQGTYHLLGGVLNPLLGIGPAELEIDHLLSRVKKEKICDMILAVNPSVEGDATCAYIRQQVDESINVERIGFGIPIGGHLEYLDSMTIAKAFENRKRMQ